MCVYCMYFIKFIVIHFFMPNQPLILQGIIMPEPRNEPGPRDEITSSLSSCSSSLADQGR
jgi:hypothetical protein